MLLDGSMVLVKGIQTAWCATAMRRVVRRHKSNGLPLPPGLSKLLDELERAEKAWLSTASGTAELPPEADSPYSEQPLDEMSTTEATEVLNISDRGIRKAIEAKKIRGRKVGRTWQLDRMSVLAYSERQGR